jgi:hypothetical protein
MSCLLQANRKNWKCLFWIAKKTSGSFERLCALNDDREKPKKVNQCPTFTQICCAPPFASNGFFCCGSQYCQPADVESLVYPDEKQPTNKGQIPI